MTHVEHVDATGVRWRRWGECNRCGECCASEGDPQNFSLVELADPERVAGYCPLFRLRDGVGTCVGYRTHPFYWSGCHTAPQLPSDMADLPSCGFAWGRVS